MVRIGSKYSPRYHHEPGPLGRVLLFQGTEYRRVYTGTRYRGIELYLQVWDDLIVIEVGTFRYDLCQTSSETIYRLIYFCSLTEQFQVLTMHVEFPTFLPGDLPHNTHFLKDLHSGGCCREGESGALTNIWNRS